MKMSKLGPKCQYFVWPPLFSNTALTLLGMEFTRASQVATGVLFHSSMTTSRSWWMLETLRSSTFCLRMSHRCSIGFMSGDMLGQSITFTLSLFSKTVVVVMLEYCPAAQFPKGGNHALLQYVTVHVGSTLAAQDHDTPTTMLDCRQDTLVFVLLTWLPPHMLDTIWTEYIYIGLIRQQDMVPLIVCGLFCASSFEEASFLDDSHADHAVCGVWSEHWQADPTPLQPLQQRWKVTNYIYSRYCNWVAFLCTCTFLSNVFNL